MRKSLHRSLLLSSLYRLFLLDLVQIGISFARKLRISEEGLTICTFDPRKVGPFFRLCFQVKIKQERFLRCQTPTQIFKSTLFLGSNLIILVTDGHIQNFKTLAQYLLGEFRWGSFFFLFFFLLPCESKVNSQVSPGVGV
jgi:hypothetical protein